MARTGPNDSLDLAFTKAMAPWVDREGPLAVLFSGGVDSGLLAWELRDRPGLVLSTVGTRGSPDLSAARDGASHIGARWVPSKVTRPEVQRIAKEFREDLGSLPPTARSVLTSFAVALARAPPGPVLCGQGVDELFLGYAHFRGLDSEESRLRSEADLSQLLDRDWPLARNIATRMERTLSAPYLDPEFIAAARGVPIQERMPAPEPKAFFRTWALRRGLPPSIALRPKRALQFGSGIDRLVFDRAETRSRHL